jgi:hypothetical protein
VGFASLYPPYGYHNQCGVSAWPQGRAEGRSPFTEGLGVSPNFPTLPPRVGARGLK